MLDRISSTKSIANPAATAGAAAAFAEVESEWLATDRSIQFTNYLSNFFHARPDLNCEDLDNPNCEVTINCGQASSPNAPVSAPAGYVIINSLMTLHTLFQNLWDGINDGLSLVQGEVGNFVSELSPITQDIAEQRADKLALDGVQLALFLGLAPTFHSAIGALQWARQNPNVVAAGFDISYGSIGTAMAFAKDAMESLSPLPVQNSIDSYIATTAERWLDALSGAAELLFNDPAGIRDAIDKGALFAVDLDQNPSDVIDTMKKTLFASALHAVWTSGDGLSYPVIATNDGLEQDGTGCESWDPTTFEKPDEAWIVNFQDDLVSSARICTGDFAFWMLAVGHDEPQSSALGGFVPTKLLFNELPGYDTLDGTRWGGLTAEAAANNAINSWIANDHKNGWSTSLSTDDASGLPQPADIGTFITGDLGQTGGVVTIPICHFSDIAANIKGDPATNPNYPCPPP
ncbi:hypothetical protein LTR37_008692 [Vermiconidia calcicola]|uniref:Uncharacterized protein n=1 Tax=Vermiconidia calcicola TaxID=1690605 RepID=A0ACC3NCK2_9PEZI|nr:hypothetical protein LTR37_008692 [Vermiconidia calcicola]